MAEIPETPAPPTPPENPSEPFDMGDTELHFEAPARIEQPRNSDGTFAPIPVEPAEQLTPPAPKHPDYLVERGRDLGLTDADMADVSTTALDRICWRMAKQQMKLQQEFGTARALDTNAVRVPAPQPAKTDVTSVNPPRPAEDEFDWGMGKDDEGNPRRLTEDDYHPVVARELKEGAKARKELAALRSDLQQRDARTTAQLIDAAFAKLGEGYQRIFGADDFGEIPSAAMTAEQSASFKRRVAVLQEAGIDVKNINRRTLVAKLKAAADLLYQAPAAPKPDDTYAAALNGTPSGAAPKPGRGSAPSPIPVEEWNRGAVARPTARVGAKELKGDALAVAKLEQRMKEAGHLTAESDAEIDDTLFE